MNKNSRRNFIKLSGLAAGAICWPSCGIKNPPALVAGEEWRHPSPRPRAVGGQYALTEEMKAQANAAIEKHRKGHFTIRLLDDQGAPVKGCTVMLKHHRHHFDWGYSGAMPINDMSPSDEKVTHYIRQLFNSTTAKCYWDEGWHQPIEQQEGKRITERFSAEVDWALANGLRVKGHPLVWTVRKAIPRWMDRYPYPVQLQKLEAHVRDLIRVGGTAVSMWDLCNEMLWEPSLRNLPHRHWPHLESIDEILTYLEPAVHWAKEENPYAQYALNDYGLVKTNAPGLTSRQQRKRYVALVDEMQRRGCAPDAVGSQCHVVGWYTAEEFSAMLNDLAIAGLPLQITEFWAHLKDCPFPEGTTDQQKALIDYVSMIYTLAFAHPRVKHLTYWGGREWFDDEREPSSLYKAMKDLIHNEWSSQASLLTNAEGEISLQAFYGDYHMLWRDDKGNQHPLNISLSKEQTSLTVKV